jgi:PEP-CTERM motif
LRIGTTVASATAPRLASAMLPFQLPAIPAGQQTTSATLTLLVVGQATANQPRANQNVDLYGLPFDTANPSFSITNARFFSGANDTTAGVTKLQDDFITPATPGVSQTSTTTYTPLTSLDVTLYLTSLYDGGAVPGNYAVFRLSDDNPDGSVLQRYRIRSAGGTAAANPDAEKPFLTITTSPVPEPGSIALAGLTVAGLAARRLRRKS